MMNTDRPSPEAWLEVAKATESQTHRGSLKIFFGYAAGVGKTYAMLEYAQRAKAAGREVVTGYVEPHARPDTQAMLTGLEQLPTKEFDYRGVKVCEFDIDAALARHSDLMLVDELAHTNVEGSRHVKRWQDVVELLEAGINVWTTLNVQHIESLNDVVGQVTGIVVRETIPDAIFETADELELVDLPPEELLSRLNAGKVYLPEQARRAIQSFFQKSNLNALRELSLRQAARRIHSEVESERRQKAVLQPWATTDRLLVCIGPSPTTARVIRTAKRMATALDAPWIAVSVDVAGQSLSGRHQAQIAEHCRLAERLGAETTTISGEDVAVTVLDFARSRNVTKIFVGKTLQPYWQRLFYRSVVDEMLEQSGEIDLYIIHGEKETAVAAGPAPTSLPVHWLGYAGAATIIAASGLFAVALRRLHLADSEANTVMLFLAAVAFVAYRFGQGPAVLASGLAVLVFDFIFVSPYFTFAVSDTQYIVTFGVMLAIGLVISTLTSRLKAQIESTRLRERRTTALYHLGKQLSSLYGAAFLVSAAGQRIAEITGGEVAIYLRRSDEIPQLAWGETTAIALHPVSVSVAEWVVQHNQIAGAGTDTLPSAVALFLPLVGSQQTMGALAVRMPEMEKLLDPDQRAMVEACANQLALSLERDQLAIDAAETRIQFEAEQVRNTLLSSVSHDLKTPLASIAGASSILLETPSLDADTRRQLLETVSEETTRLNRLLENILQMSRLDAGAVVPNTQWHVLEEIVGSALHRMRQELADHPVEVKIPPDLPLIWVDGLLLEQALVNLLENAGRYTPPQTPIQVTATTDRNWLRLTVADSGPGLPLGVQEKLFDKFYRGSHIADGGRGSGLGLAICRAIAKVHGGNITAATRPQGGAEFVLRLPLVAGSPQVIVD